MIVRKLYSISFLGLALGMLTVACSSKGESSNQKENTTTLQLGECAPSTGSYKIHYTRISGDAEDCADIADKVDDVQTWEPEVIQGCTVNVDKASCSFTTQCEFHAQHEAGEVTTTSNMTTKLTKDSTSGTVQIVMRGGTAVNDCSYAFTYTKQ